MKKLMMIAAVAACAIQAQAATTWTATIDFGTDYSGYSVWAVNAWNSKRADIDSIKSLPAPDTGVSSKIAYGTALDTTDTQTQLDLLNNKAYDKDLAVVAGALGLETITVDLNGKATITSSKTDNEQYGWLFVLVDGLSNGKATYGTEYAVIQANDPYFGTATKSEDYEVGNYEILKANTTLMTDGIVAIPEPTSGLLLLLGMAGLCLRRKQRG